MPTGATTRRQKAGFTILEAVLSLVIAILILSVVYSIHQTVLAVRRGTEAREEGPVAVMRALNQLSRDLMCATPLGTAAPLQLLPAPTGTNASELILFTLAPDAGDSTAPEWHSIQRVRYLIRETEQRTRQLIKETSPHPFIRENDTQTNILLRNVAAFRVDMLTDGQWVAEWEATEQQDWPKAARLFLQREKEEPFQTEVFLPAGCLVTSSLTRASTTP